jgi:membrane fusion protein (multidrug efflux system)
MPQQTETVEDRPRSEEPGQEDRRERSARAAASRGPGVFGYVREHPARVLIGGAVLICLAVGASFVWKYLQSYESTDDAQIDGHMNMISTRIPGTVKAVHIRENQPVTAGQLLAEIDPTDYTVAVAQAEANLAQARARVQAAHPAVPITQTTTETTIAAASSEIAGAEAAVAAAERQHQADLARVRQAEAMNAQAQADLARYRMLVAKDEVSRQEYDSRVAAATSAAAAVEGARQAADASQKLIEQQRAAVAQANSRLEQAQRTAPQQLSIERADIATEQASVKAAQAALEQARLNVAYTRIVAPVAGVVGGKALEIGMRVQPGQPLLSIVQLDNIWVTANFKETQLKRMRPGQRATIHVDAFDLDYEGYVESFPGATTAKYSLLPPENASGNFVKVVQRLPVRLRFKPGQDPEHRLRPGMSVVPKVWL